MATQKSLQELWKYSNFFIGKRISYSYDETGTDVKVDIPEYLLDDFSMLFPTIEIYEDAILENIGYVSFWLKCHLPEGIAIKELFK